MNEPVLEKLLSLLQIAIKGTLPDAELFTGMSIGDWELLYQRAAQEGILAIAFDCVMQLPEELQPPQPFRFKWAGSVDFIEQKSERMHSVAQDLAARFGEEGIRMLVVKGLSIAQYYPEPSHREFGDLDIYLFEHYETGNQWLEQWGIPLISYTEKHTKFSYREISVENHSHFISLPLHKKQSSQDDQRLKAWAAETHKNAAPGSILFPDPDFSLVFFMYHALGHFIPGRLSWRYFFDWAIILRANKGKWDQAHYDAMFPIGSGFRRIADVITSIAVDYLGLPSDEAPFFDCDTEAKKKIVEEMIRPASHYEGHLSRWKILTYKYRQFVRRYWRMELAIPGSFKRSIVYSILYHFRYPETIWRVRKR